MSKNNKITIIKAEDKDIDKLTSGLARMSATDYHDGKQSNSPKKLIYHRYEKFHYVADFADLKEDQLKMLLKLFDKQFKSDSLLLEAKDARKMIYETFAPKLRDFFVNMLTERDGNYFTTSEELWYKAYRLLQFVTTHVYPKITLSVDNKQAREQINAIKHRGHVVYFNTAQFCWDLNFGMVGPPKSYKAKKFMYMSMSIDSDRRPKTYFLDKKSTDLIVATVKKACVYEEDFLEINMLVNNKESYVWTLIDTVLRAKRNFTLITSNNNINQEILDIVWKVIKLANPKHPARITTIVYLGNGYGKLDPSFYWVRDIMNHYLKTTLNFNDLTDIRMRFESVNVDKYISKSLLQKKLDNSDLLELFRDVCGNTLNISVK